VYVVAAGVHHTGHLGGVGHVILLLDGQRVHVGPQGDGRAFSAGKVADDAGAGHAAAHGNAQLSQARRHQPGGVVLLERQLGMAVDGTTERYQLVPQLLRPFIH